MFRTLSSSGVGMARPASLTTLLPRVSATSSLGSGSATASYSTASEPTRKPASSRRQNSLPASYYRGGSSRAVFFQEQDLPPRADAAARAAVFLGVIGSPDPYGRQLDGLGGGISSLSKVCIVGPPTRPDADIDYTFVALGIRDGSVDYSSNCGNMSAAVGPYAVDSGMLPLDDAEASGASASGETGLATVRIHNTNTGKMIHATFPVVDGEAAASGDYAIDGVAGTAAPVELAFVDPAGSRTGALLPTGSVADTFLPSPGGDGVRVTCIDVGNPCCFVQAADLGVPGTLTPDQVEADAPLKAKLEAIRREAGVRMGLAASADEVPGSVPKIAIVSPSDCDGGSGGSSAVVDNRVTVRAMSVGQAHKAIPVTVALAVAAASRLRGSTVADCFANGAASDGPLDIAHASGLLKVDASYSPEGELRQATVFRTARRLMEGRVFWK